MSSGDPPLPPEGITYYQLLGVSEDAPEADIQNAYRQLIKIYHPDQWDHWAADDVVQRLREAYEVLTNPRARQRYNQVGHKDYTGEESASMSEIREWIDDVNGMIDVDNSAKVGEVTEGKEGTIDADDEFETSGESMSAEEVFDQIDADISPTSFDEVQEEAAGEESDDTPDYVSETGVEDINRPAAQDRESAEASHEEQVRRRAETRSRTRDPTTKAADTGGSGDAQQDTLGGVPTRESGTDARKSVNAALKTLQSKLSDDVVYRAVRRAWFTRLAVTAALFAIEIVLGEMAAKSGLGVVAGILPTFDAFSSGAGVTALAVTTVLVFAGDQIKTERDTSRGVINSAAAPRRSGAVSVALNAAGAVLFLHALNRGANPVAALGEMASGVLPVGVWTDATFALGPLAGGAVLNGLIGVSMASMLVFGYLFGLIEVTRFVWYHRYVTGHRVMPFWWDTALGVPTAVAVWALLTGTSSVAVPKVVGGALLSVPLFAQMGVGQTTVALPALLFLSLSVPSVFGVALYVRVTAERNVAVLLD